MSAFEPILENLNAGAFMATAAQEGMGVTEARNLMRSYGLAMSNETFGQMYSQVREALASRDAIAGLDYSAVPPADAFVDWSAGAEGDYATFVTSYVRPPGSRDVEERYYTFVTDEPHTPQDAIDAAANFYTDEDLVSDSMQGGAYVGSVVTSMTRTIGGG